MAENTFVIRIWCEHSEQKNARPQFRGVIEHVPSGERQYLTGTQGIYQFIQNHLPKTSDNLTNKPHSINQRLDQEDH